jgi:hypothetical protein
MPWITQNLKYLMSLRNKAHSKYKKNKTNQNWESYRQLRNFVTASMDREKKAFLEDRIRRNGSRDNWKLLRELKVYGKEKSSVPDELGTVDEINDYFVNIPQVDPDPDTLNFYLNGYRDNILSFDFRMATTEEISTALFSIKSKAVGTDGISINMLMYCHPFILPVITHLVNYCIETRTFPDAWKTSYVLPIPKVSSPSEQKDLRPVSILPALSKVLEKILNSQMKEYVEQCSVLPATQSGFRRDYSCNTALIKVTDDIFQATERGELTTLVLLDYSKAFDKLNHTLMLAILKYLGFGESSCNLLEDYLRGRSQRVMLNGKVSQPKDLLYGVPQGSILGPLLFSLYTSQIVSYLSFCRAHFYADDTQIYISFKPDEIVDINTKVNDDLGAILKASRSHCLDINPNKSHILLFGKTKPRNSCLDKINIKVDGQGLQVVKSAKNLGLVVDTDLRFSEHVNVCIRRAFANLKIIYSQKEILNESLRKMLCDSIVLSHFNFADVIYGPCLLSVDAYRIQLIQNCCVRLIGGIRGRERGVSAKLREIKWLRMNERRVLHSLVLFNKIIIMKRPNYLHEKIKFRHDIHNLDIRHKNDITIPGHVSANFERSFSFNIAKLYNKVPEIIKFYSGLKFKAAVKNIIGIFL